MFKKVTNIVIFALIFALYFVSFLMIYDSFRERKEVKDNLNIPVFDVDMICIISLYVKICCMHYEFS